MQHELQAEVTLVKSSGGVFEVIVDEVLVYSKRRTGEFPDQEALVRRLGKG
jgi:selT/selW/selH-like putative selenoprotein